MEDERNNQASERRIKTPESIATGIMIEIPKLILASASPRRAEILRSIGWPFEALPTHIDESREESEKAHAYVERVALVKAVAAAAHSHGWLVLGAATVVVIDHHILRKPRDDAHPP